METIPFILGVGLIFTGVLILFTSWGTRDEIKSADPVYAGRLFQPLPDQFFLGRWPVRSRVLFFEAPPPKALATIRLLRGIYIAHWVLFLAFMGFILASLVGRLAA